MSRSQKGKVSISEQRGWLRLRWTYQKRRYEISLSLPDTPTNRALAQQRAAIIEADMLSGQFDETLGIKCQAFSVTRQQDSRVGRSVSAIGNRITVLSRQL